MFHVKQSPGTHSKGFCNSHKTVHPALRDISWRIVVHPSNDRVQTTEGISSESPAATTVGAGGFPCGHHHCPFSTPVDFQQARKGPGGARRTEPGADRSLLLSFVQPIAVATPAEGC
jgi:hypothetical protein